MEDKRTAIGGGASLGLLVGLIYGFFTDNYWKTVIYALLIGLAVGVVAELLGKLSDRMKS
ncbi:hypothetical protein HYS84_03725 [Candidatus Saccharibacteria bacterium]|nr:hypothetical protein [Candidatus Saccharibacteria bacterium]